MKVKNDAVSKGPLVIVLRRDSLCCRPVRKWRINVLSMLLNDVIKQYTGPNCYTVKQHIETNQMLSLVLAISRVREQVCIHRDLKSNLTATTPSMSFTTLT